jgi:hypothetical protein
MSASPVPAAVREIVAEAAARQYRDELDRICRLAKAGLANGDPAGACRRIVAALEIPAPQSFAHAVEDAKRGPGLTDYQQMVLGIRAALIAAGVSEEDADKAILKAHGAPDAQSPASPAADDPAAAKDE